MNITSFKTDILHLDLTLEEVKAINARNPDTVAELDEQFHKFESWAEDVKRIKTKQLLAATEDTLNSIAYHEQRYDEGGEF